MIERELSLHLIAYNLVRCLMQQASIIHHVDLSSLSFKGSLDTLAHFADAIHALQHRARKQAVMMAEMLAIIAADPLPIRPFRSEPRVKRRAETYRLIDKPPPPNRPATTRKEGVEINSKSSRSTCLRGIGVS